MATRIATHEPTRTHTPAHEWIGLQRAVAVGQIVVFVGIMLVVRGQVVPPLAVAAALFAAGASVSLRTARIGAIVVGVMSALWLASNVAFSAQVVPDLLAVAVTEIFVPTFVMNVLAVAGTIGLLGTVGRAPGRLAVATMRVVGAFVTVGTVASVVAGLA